MTRRPRAWVLPLVFALIALSLPAQMVFAERFSEPYPGLFQPFFHGASASRVYTGNAVEIAVDGRRIEPFDLFPADGPARGVVATMFPPDGGGIKVDDRTRESIRSTLTRRLATEPRILAVTWERRRFDVDTGTMIERAVVASYRLDLAGPDR